ncbi:MAG TPA: NUDIX domain-containing protein [Methylomirabilota bacterium]|nr:NUDIX domain-containing protein [Methylomirabilota bacterium]
MDVKRPIVGVGIMIFKEDKVLVGKRKGSHGAGEYAWPGGKLDFNESIVECAKRETREETGIEIENVKFLRLMNFIKDGNHFVDIAMIADWKSGEPKVMEPEKCESWQWYDQNNLPKPLFGTLPTYFEALKTGKIFFDT